MRGKSSRTRVQAPRVLRTGSLFFLKLSYVYRV